MQVGNESPRVKSKTTEKSNRPMATEEYSLIHTPLVSQVIFPSVAQQGENSHE